MNFHTRTITKDLQSIPFDVCYELYHDAATVAGDTAEAENLQKYEEYISRLEEEWTSCHEAPYEGNFSDEVPYRPLPNLASIKRKAGHAAIVSDFIPRYKLDTILQTLVLPQIIHWLVHKPIDLASVRNEAGKINGLKMLDKIFDSKNEWDLGLYQFLMMDSRSAYIKSQYKPEGRAYCSLVPYIPYAFKLNHSVKYGEWDRSTLKWVVNDSLCQAMLLEVPEDLSREDIIEAREKGLIYKTGAKAGQSRSPVSTFKLYDTTGTKLHKMPELAQTMLAQIWCAHPANRTKYMVLDPSNWDNIPTPLVSDDIFSGKSTYIPIEKQKDMPWL